MLRLLKRLCAIKKSMVAEFESIFPLPKGPIPLLLVFTWVDLLTVAVEAVVAVAENAAEVTAMTTMDTAAAVAHAVAVMAAEVAAHLPLITEVVHEGTIDRAQDLTHLVAIDSL